MVVCFSSAAYKKKCWSRDKQLPPQKGFKLCLLILADDIGRSRQHSKEAYVTLVLVKRGQTYSSSVYLFLADDIGRSRRQEAKLPYWLREEKRGGLGLCLHAHY